MKLPEEFLDSLNGLKGFDREEFIKAHEYPESITSIRLNPQKESRIESGKARVPWTEYGYYLEERPSFTFDPLFHAGCYYVQEASSMFIEQAFRQLTDLSQPLKVLDLRLWLLVSSSLPVFCRQLMKNPSPFILSGQNL